MHPPTTLLILTVAVAAGTAAMVHGGHHPAAASTPAAARFWQQALPGTPMPDAIADLVQKGIDHSPLAERYPALPGISVCGAWTNSDLCTRTMAAATGIFFREAELRPGTAMALSFPAEVEPPILLAGSAAAAAAPFGNLTAVLATFGIPAGSAEAEHVRGTLERCASSAPPRVAGAGEGELVACATSLETMVRSAMRMLGGAGAGGGGSVWAAATSSPVLRAGLPRGRYVVAAVTALDGDRFVACHRVPFPYAVYQCHTPARPTADNKAYVVTLHGGRRRGGPAPVPAVDVLAFCHRDTSGWNPDHPALEILHVRPGTPVCHFIPYGNPVFGLKASKA